MGDVNTMTTAELDLYCGLLKHAYNIQLERTGLVWGSAAEALRDKMYESIRSIDPLMGLEWCPVETIKCP